jgi:hypothetical protein
MLRTKSGGRVVRGQETGARRWERVENRADGGAREMGHAGGICMIFGGHSYKIDNMGRGCAGRTRRSVMRGGELAAVIRHEVSVVRGPRLLCSSVELPGSLIWAGGSGQAAYSCPSPYSAPSKGKGRSVERPFLFLPSIFRIPSSAIKPAKYLSWLWFRSGLESVVITLEFGTRS